MIRDLIRTENLEEANIVLLQVTSPFRNVDDILALQGRMVALGVDSGVSVCRYRQPASPPFEADDDLSRLGAEAAAPGTCPGRESRWDRESHWAINGAVYIFNARNFLQTDRLYTAGSAIHVMENWRSIDIDYPDDYILAKALADTLGL